MAETPVKFSQQHPSTDWATLFLSIKNGFLFFLFNVQHLRLRANRLVMWRTLVWKSLTHTAHFPGCSTNSYCGKGLARRHTSLKWNREERFSLNILQSFGSFLLWTLHTNWLLSAEVPKNFTGLMHNNGNRRENSRYKKDLLIETETNKIRRANGRPLKSTQKGPWTNYPTYNAPDARAGWCAMIIPS